MRSIDFQIGDLIISADERIGYILSKKDYYNSTWFVIKWRTSKENVSHYSLNYMVRNGHWKHHKIKKDLL